MRKRDKIFLTALVSLFSCSFAFASGSIGIRPYVKVGVLLNAPTAADLGYESVGGESVEKYLDMNKTHWGVGVQYHFLKSASQSFRKTTFGLDAGYEKLFSSKYDLGLSGFEGIEEDYHKDSENALFAMFFAQLNSQNSPMYLQAGVGPHLVFWKWNYYFSDIYGSQNNNEDSGTGVSPGFFAAAGTNFSMQNMQVPVAVRLDVILRHSTLIMASVMIGLNL